MALETPIILTVPGGPRLEARLALPDAPAGGVVLCHPHPLYGGDMDSPVVTQAAEAARRAGLSTLRFNFRGVGGAEGKHGGGEAERDDVATALVTLGERLPPGRPLGLLGYSFGAWVAARVACQTAGLAGLCLIAPPVEMLAFPALDGGGPEMLLVGGTRDPYCPVEGLERLAAQCARCEPVTIDGADHFFAGSLAPLGEAVAAWALRWARP